MKLKLKRKVAACVFALFFLSVAAAVFVMNKQCERAAGWFRPGRPSYAFCPLLDGMKLKTEFTGTRVCAWMGDSGCQSELGAIYLAGRKAEQDFAEAAYWNRRAAEGGDENARKRQPDIEFLQSLKAKKDSAECKGVPADDTSHLISLAEQGDVRAQRELGNRRIEPVKWYRLAAEQGDVEAELQTGSIYFYGDGMGTAVEKDLFEAIKWFKKAAEHGDTDAPTILANLYQMEIVAAYEGKLHDADKWTEAVRYSANLPYRIYTPGLIEELGIAKGRPRLAKTIDDDFAEMYYWASFDRRYPDYEADRAAYYLTAKKKAELDAKLAATKKQMPRKSEKESMLNIAGLMCGNESLGCKVEDNCGDIVMVECPHRGGEYLFNFVSKAARRIVSRSYCSDSVPKEWDCGPPAGMPGNCSYHWMP